MTIIREHIGICICTYKRPRLLKRLLVELSRQRTQERFEFSIVVVDNDSQKSAEPVVSVFAASMKIPITYCVEAEQNIALARNRAIRNVTGDYVVFIDDDEYPGPDWLLTLFEARSRYEADGVLGPVKPEFEEQPPAWVIKGRFYERSSYPTGFVIDWRKGRTGNVLLKRKLFAGLQQPFRPDFLTGEDQDFFRRMIELGHVFIWCNEAVAYEMVPSIRWNRSFMLRRALLRGKISLRHPTSGTLDIVRSAVAVPLYTVALPFLLLLGQHHFMRYLIKTCDHAGRLLAFVGVNPVKEKYVTE
jgi:succinoglycan biosynthesis protein ExoM